MESNKTVAEIELQNKQVEMKKEYIAELRTGPMEEGVIDATDYVLKPWIDDGLTNINPQMFSTTRTSDRYMDRWTYAGINTNFKTMEREELERVATRLEETVMKVNHENTMLNCDLADAEETINKLKKDLNNYKEVENDW